MDTVFAVPALPPRLVAANPATNGNDSSSNSPLGNANIPKKPPAVPKSVFPEAHVQFLLQKITQLQASSINALVESIYLELREHKVKKIAIEAKVKEVGEKCKEKKVWVIKPALLVSRPFERVYYPSSNMFCFSNTLKSHEYYT
jgi:chromatin assembly factor 1 subunit A